MNQITDNRSILQLLHEPGFRWLARQGMISLSGFTRRYEDGSSYNADSPAAYLRMCLEDSKFQFSSTGLYKLPPMKGKKDSPRTAMLKHLQGICNSRFVRECTPSEWWEELDFLLDSYRIASEVFQPSDLRRYHQDPNRRFPAAAQQPARSLADIIRQRGEALREQNGRTNCMEAFAEYIREWGHLGVRSEYKDAVDKALETASGNDAEYLRKFRSFVYDCYFLSNGKRSSRTVLLEQPDPELRLPDDRTINIESEKPRYSLHLQHKEPTLGHSALNWDELTNIALLARRLKVAYRTLKLDSIAEKVSRETGIPCRAQNGDIVAVDMTVKTTQRTSEIIAAETSGSDETYQEVY